MYEYNPFLVGQILEEQNVYLIKNGKIFNKPDYSEFNNILWKGIDGSLIPNTIRLFEYEGYVYLTYYWSSTLKEPGSDRLGIYLVMGTSCSKQAYRKNRFGLAKLFQNFFMSVIDETKPSTLETANDALNYLWNLKLDGSPLVLELNRIIDYYIDYSISCNNDEIDNNLLSFVENNKLSLFKKMDAKENLTVNCKRKVKAK